MIIDILSEIMACKVTDCLRYIYLVGIDDLCNIANRQITIQIRPTCFKICCNTVIKFLVLFLTFDVRSSCCIYIGIFIDSTIILS